MKYQRRWVYLCGMLVANLWLNACSYFSDKGAGKTISDLPRAQLDQKNNQVSTADHNKIENTYRSALAAAEDPVLRQQIMTRMADFEMARSEERQLQATEAGRHFDKPIAQYRELIAMQEQSGEAVKGVDINRLRYKLAKALSMDGRNDEAAKVLDQLAETAPASPFIAETQFRRAEKAFAVGNYLAAEKHYQSVAADKQSPLQQNAVYMQGWSEFKHGDYDLSLQTFTQVMDQLLAGATKPKDVATAQKNLSAAQTNMLTDTLHVMSLAFSYLDGAKAIADLQKKLGERPYQHLFYENLGQLYEEQKRFSDAADTYKFYVAENSLADFAPLFSIKMMDVYERGNFPSLILPAKQDYVQHYGINSRYWAQRQGAIGDTALTFLHQSLQELAQYEHALAQEKSQQVEKNKSMNSAETAVAYQRAAVWYREFIASFPQDSKNAEMTFLLAECLNEAGDSQQAVAAYEQVAYHYKDTAPYKNASRGAEAGYSALLLAQQLAVAPALTESQKVHWQERKTQSALDFAKAYPGDTRAAAVLTQAAQELLLKGKLNEAIAIAEQVIQRQPAADPLLQFNAWLILGHSQFDAKNYSAAEKAYTQVLLLLPGFLATPEAKKLNAPTALQINERIAASIYQQAQSDLAQGQKDLAIAKLLRVNEVAPTSDVALKAQYDAGVYLIEQQKWSEAEKVYSAFRQQHPQHELAASIPAKMVVIYQNQGKWALAASELSLLERGSNDPNVKRQALALGAELYEKSGNKTLAIEMYQRYANEYPKPIAEAMEAQSHLAQLYLDNRDLQKHQYWLQRIIESHAAAGSQATARSTYLAASAANELAAPAYKDFASLPLTLPLKQSLQRKRAALDKALKGQEAVLKYGVAEFTTQASFRIGEIYAQLSRDLLKSERPKDLDALALEQYDLLLEEQAFPFEEKAIQVHQANAQRSWTGIYDSWVKDSFVALAGLLPARYKKSETQLEVSNEIQ
ncbi:MAG TPA: tetratricopeptide repeat protein [Cellvibrio sp.]|nr:tetratricopeptide repeat protein [Cellvibrio sp.]